MERALAKSKIKDGTPRYSKKNIKWQIDKFSEQLYGEESS